MKTTYNINIPPDEEGMVGRECPNCNKYFKIKPGTGISNNPVMYCPYCEHRGKSSEFTTKEQLEYAKSIVVRDALGEMGRELKKLERHSFRSPFISFEIKVKEPLPPPIRYYIEKQLQENVRCEDCSCEYAIYGIFAFCPDCGKSNIFQMFKLNLDLIKRQIELKDKLLDSFESQRDIVNNMFSGGLGDKLFEDACENAVTVFEAFFKKVYSRNISSAHNLTRKLKGNCFQSLDETRDIFVTQFGLDIFEGLDNKEIESLYLLFNKRHILTHNLGIIDEKYLKNTGLRNDVLGHKVSVTDKEILSSLASLLRVANNVQGRFDK